MSEDPASVLPEFAQLLHKASQANSALYSMPEGDLIPEHRQALVDLIGFIREYDINILDKLVAR